MAKELTVIEHFFKIIEPLGHLTCNKIINIGTSMAIPRFEEGDVRSLCESVIEVLKPQGPLLRLEPPVYVVGDIHGDLHDLFRILSEIGDWEHCQVVFLGDYIDRGGFSVEVIIVLFTLVLKYPKNFFLLRGNHEFPNVYNCTSLSDELKFLYHSTDLFDIIQEAFTWMPLAALVGSAHLCLHGGIGPTFETIEDIEKIPYPVKDYDNKLVSDILWSDPCKTIMNFLESTRGCGMFFGQTAISNFLTRNNLKMLIRGHQCVYQGTDVFRDMVMTVFSSSFYNDEENRGAFVEIQTNLEIKVHALPPMKPVRRQFASYGQVSPRDHSMKRPMRKVDVCKSRKTILPRLANEKRQKRLSLTLVPAIVKPRLPKFV